MSVTKLNSIRFDCGLFDFYIHSYFECANKLCQRSVPHRYESRAPHDCNLGTTWHSAPFSCHPQFQLHSNRVILDIVLSASAWYQPNIDHFNVLNIKTVPLIKEITSHHLSFENSKKLCRRIFSDIN